MTSVYAFRFSLSEDQYNNLIEMAGYGVGYWASFMESTDDGCHLTEEETGKKFFLKPRDIERAALELFATCPLNDRYTLGIAKLVAKRDDSDVDGDVADAIIQHACFREVKYG